MIPWWENKVILGIIHIEIPVLYWKCNIYMFIQKKYAIGMDIIILYMWSYAC